MKIQISSIFLYIFFAAGLAAQPITRHALLVGIGQYPKESKWPKLHADEDAKKLFKEFRKLGFLEGNIKMLLNENATHDNIRLSLKKLADQAEPEDQIVIYLGGHSQQITDISNEETDGKDEAFVPYDAFPKYKGEFYEGKSHLLDDELAKWISLLSVKITSYGSLFVLYDGGISDVKSATLPTKGIFPPFKIPAFFKEPAALESKDNEWLDVSYSENLSQLTTLDPGSGHNVSEILMDGKNFGSPLVKAYLLKLVESGENKRYRSLNQSLQTIFSKAKLPKAFMLDGAINAEMVKASKINMDTLGKESTESQGDFNIFTIVIGVSNYLEIAKLKFGHLDADLFSTTIDHVYKGKLKKENQFLFLDSMATIKPIMDALETVTAKAGANDRIYFYFAGHGDVEELITKKAHLLLFDSPPHVYKAGGTLRVEDLKDYFTQWIYKKARVYLVVDACKSGKLAGGTEGRALVSQNLNELQFQSARLLSCQPNEMSLESTNYGGGHGAFTYFLVQGINGEANTNGDKDISLGEIKKFIVDSVSSSTLHSQNPLVQGNSKLTFLPAPGKPNLLEAKTANIASTSEKGMSPAEDSLRARWTRELRLEIASGHFVEPKDKSAKNTLERISNKWPFEKKFLSVLKREVANGIVLKSQRLINEYIQGNELITKESVFAGGAKEMELLLDLIELNNPLYFTYLSRKYFFEGRSIVPSLVDNDKKRYLLNSALQNLQTSLKYEPEGAHNFNAIGRLQYVNRQYEEAISNYKKAIKLAPGWKFPVNNLAVAYDEFATKKGKTALYDSAIFYYNQSIKLDPEFALAYSYLGRTYENLEKYEEAKQFFLKSIFLNPSKRDSYLYIGNLFRKQEKWDSAAYYLQQGISIQPNDVEILTDLGNVYYDKSNALSEQKPALLKKAKQYYFSAYELDSLCRGSIVGIGNYYFDNQIYDSARIFYSKHNALDSNNLLYRNYLIESIIRSGDLKAAEKLAAIITKRFPDNGTNWFNLGLISCLKKDYKSAEKRLTTAAKLEPLEKKWFEDEKIMDEFRKTIHYQNLLKYLK